MKIIHVMNWYIPHMGYQENFLPQEQKKMGHDITIITSDRYPIYKGLNEKKRIQKSGIFNDNGIAIHRMKTKIDLSKNGQIILSGLKNKLLDLKPDIVHAHGAFTPISLLSIYHQKRIGYKLFIDDHTDVFNFELNSILKRKYIEYVKRIHKRYKNRIDKYLPITYGTKKILMKYLEIGEHEMELLPLGADDSIMIKSNKYRTTTRKALNYSDNDIVIITTGKLNETKDIDILIKVFNILVRNYNHIKLLIIGNGPEEYMNKLETLAKENKDKIIFKDFVENRDLPKYFNAADIGTWPGNPSVTINEAMATGLPIVIPRNDLVYDHIFEKDGAVSFGRRDENGLYRSLDMMISDNKIRDHYSNQGFKLIKNELSWNKIAHLSLEIYNSK